jgi:transposase
MDEYDGKQFVGIDLHRQRSVIVRQSESGEQLSAVRILNDPASLQLQLEGAGADPEVVLEATYGWYWAVDVLQAGGARVHLAHPLGVKGFRYRRVKNDVRDAADLADLLRMGDCPRRGSPHRTRASCGSWCATEPSWWRSDPDSRRRSTRCSPKPAC